MPDFTIETIRGYLLAQGGRVEYHKLIQYFKQSLKDQDARLLFKDCVNALADVVHDSTAKFLVLKPDQYFCQEDSPVLDNQIVEAPVVLRNKQHAPPLPQLQPVLSVPQRTRPISINDNYSQGFAHQLDPRHYQQQPLAAQRQHSLPMQQPQHMSHHNSAFNTASGINRSPPHHQPVDHPPQPPPRRRSSSNNGQSASSYQSTTNYAGKTDDRVVQQVHHESAQLDKAKLTKSLAHHDEKLREIHDLAKTPGRVKEHADKWNRMTSESDLKVVATAAASGHQSARSSQSKEDGDTDSATVNQPLDPLRKQWMLAAALRETSELAGMLMEDAKLADFKDITSYTALHWAAKFGKEDLVELLAGKYFVNPNAKSGGYTPLHLANMFGHVNIRDMLLKYHADPSIRDHSGKLPKHYLKQSKENMATKVPEAETKSKLRKTPLEPELRSPLKLARPLSAFTNSPLLSPKHKTKRSSFWEQKL